MNAKSVIESPEGLKNLQERGILSISINKDIVTLDSGLPEFSGTFKLSDITDKRDSLTSIIRFINTFKVKEEIIQEPVKEEASDKTDVGLEDATKEEVIIPTNETIEVKPDVITKDIKPEDTNEEEIQNAVISEVKG